MDIELSLKLSRPGETKDDYAVIWTTEQFGKWSIGRIEFLPEAAGSDQWSWAVNLPVPIPLSCKRREASLAEAQAAFRKAWETLLPTLTEAAVAECVRGSPRRGGAQQAVMTMLCLWDVIRLLGQNQCRK